MNPLLKAREVEPGALGGNGFTPSDPAPGRYVLDR
jgi:hypothetical protein